MRIVIAGGHGQIALKLGALLAKGGHEPVGLIRKPEQQGDLRDAGLTPVVIDLEDATVDQLADVLRGADAVVFAAGAGAGSGPERQDAVDRAGAVLLGDAAEEAGVERYVLISSMGVDSVRDGATPDGMAASFVSYLQAKLAAEDDLLARDGLDLTVLRPGALTDDEPTGTVLIAETVERGEIPRGDVAAVVASLATSTVPTTQVLELVGGTQSVEDALTALA